MSDTQLVITPDTIYISKTEQNSLKEHLEKSVVFKGKVTFERLFNLILKEQAFFETAFATQLGNYSLDAFKEEFKQDIPNNNLKALNVGWVLSSEKWHGDTYYNHYVDFHADEIQALDFMSLGEFKHLPIIIEKKSIFSLFDMDKNSYIFKEEIEKDMTLYELIGGILQEITFYGTPKQREKTWCGLKKQAKHVENES